MNEVVEMRSMIFLLGLICCVAFGNMYAQDMSFDFDEEDQICPYQIQQKAVNPAIKTIYKLLLITGCARSGTTYITAVLRHCGLDILHENAGRHGTVSWLMATRDYHTPYGPAYFNFHFKHIFHQVRNPLKAMSSFTTESPQAWQFVMKHTPQIKIDDPQIVKCAKYWYYWNQKADKKAEWTYRVEDIENALEEMGNRMGIHLDKEAIKKVEKTLFHRNRNVDYSWEDLKANLTPVLYKKVIGMARKYGYEAPDWEALP